MASETDNIPGLDAARETLVSAFLRQDFPALAALFAADAALMPPRTRIIRDRGAIREFWAGVSEQVKEIALEPLEVTSLGGDALREIGRMRMSAGDHPPQIALNKYLALWQRAEATWLIGSLIWNRIVPAQGRTRLRQNENRQISAPQLRQLYSG